MQKRLMRTAQRTDDDITDEATGRARVEWAAASSARRTAEMRMLTQRNMEMKRRLARATPRFEEGVFRQAPLSPEQETSRLGEAEKVAAQVAKIRAELDALKKQAQAGLTLDQLHVRKGLKQRSKSTPTAPVVLEPSSPATYQKATGKWHKELFRLDA